MKIGFHYHIPAISKGDGIYMPGHLGRFIDSLADYCDQVICFLHTPFPDEIIHMDYRILSGNVRLVDIGPHTNVIELTLKVNKYITIMRRHTSDLDLLLVRGPSPLLPAMVAASPVPTALLLVGDYVAGVNELPQPRWRKEAIRLWSYWNKWGQNRAASHSLTFVNSRVLFDELKGKVPFLHEIRTTTLTRDDFFIRQDTCQARPYRLLYVGRMDRSKGLLQMVEAVSLLTERGEDVILDLVGWPERGDPILNEITALANRKNISEKIHYLGSRSLGPDLFECYQHADIFLTVSLASEGFPRTIWEAMAHSLPVVATRVGSIPAFVEEAAELVEPRRPLELTEAISRLIHDGERRRHLIRVGQKLAQENTVENRACDMASIIRNYLSHGSNT